MLIAKAAQMVFQRQCTQEGLATDADVSNNKMSQLRKSTLTGKESMMICGKDLNQLPGTMPFDKMEYLDYYDGPVSGVICCSDCQEAYYFYMLDWDDNHEVRIFALSPISMDQYREYLHACAQYPTGNIPDSWDREEAYNHLLNILSPAKPGEFVIAWQTKDDVIIVGKHWEADSEIDLQPFSLYDNNYPSYNWFGFLGLSVEGRSS